MASTKFWLPFVDSFCLIFTFLPTAHAWSLRAEANMGWSRWESDISIIHSVNNCEDRTRYGSPAALWSLRGHEPRQDRQVKQLPLLRTWTTPAVYTARLWRWVTVFAQRRSSPRNPSNMDVNKSPVSVLGQRKSTWDSPSTSRPLAVMLTARPFTDPFSCVSEIFSVSIFSSFKR